MEVAFQLINAPWLPAHQDLNVKTENALLLIYAQILTAPQAMFAKTVNASKSINAPTLYAYQKRNALMDNALHLTYVLMFDALQDIPA